MNWNKLQFGANQTRIRILIEQSWKYKNNPLWWLSSLNPVKDLSTCFSLFAIPNAIVFHFSCGLQTNNNHSCYLISKTIRQTLVKLYCIILFNRNLLICKWQLLYVLLMLDNWLFQNMFMFIFHFSTRMMIMYTNLHTHTHTH